MPTLALLAVNSQNPTYQELPSFQKEQFWPIPAPEGATDANGNPIEFFLLPKGFEVGAVFGTIPELIIQTIDESYGPRTRDAMLRVILDTFSLNPIPQLIRPGVLAGNPFGDFEGFNTKFSGTPVVPEDLKGVRRSEQFRPWTSATMVALARIMSEELGVEMSPVRAEEIFKGYLGLLGGHALTAADVLVEAVEGRARTFNRLDEIPLVSPFITIGPQKRSSFTDSFYDMLTETRIITATITKQLARGETRTLQETALDDTEKVLAGKGFRDTMELVATKLAELRRQRDVALFLEKDPQARDRVRNETQSAINEIVYELARGLPEDIVKKFGFAPTPGARK